MYGEEKEKGSQESFPSGIVSSVPTSRPNGAASVEEMRLQKREKRKDGK